MAGIKETKELVAFSMALVKTAVEVAADGKVGLSDLVTLVGALKDAPDALVGIDQIPAELSDLSPEEVTELVAFIKEKFDLADDELEAKIELGFDVAASVASAILKWKA